uniref:Reverse transcriptase Ty1/copia-type domain-containing protein n=1 Tax=Tanacetum cinerariifolium TaxID=118510 RepID=A0A699I1F9_TANCI|nr:hypothetical protein [Tanacetum cinerariifolium]
MHGDETPNAYLNHAQEYVDALPAIGELVKDKDLVMLVVSDAGANNYVTPDLEVMDNLEAYYGDDALHVDNDKGLPILRIVLHLSPTSQTSPKSSNGQPSPVWTTSIPTPPPSTPPPPPPITQQRPVNLRQNPKQWVPYNPSANHAIVLSTIITEPTSFTIANNSPEWRQAIKEEYDTLMKNRTWSLVPRAFNTNVVDGNNKGTIDNIISQLGSAFALKDLGPLNYFLGIEIVLHVSGILLSQKNLDDSTAFSNPVKYRQVVGSLQYVTLSRSDIAFAVNKVCQYMHAPTENHWSTVKRVLHYLHGTVEHCMLIRRSSGSTLQVFTDVLWKGNLDTSLEAFSDVDWAGDSDDRRSTGGFVIYLAEYKALADTVAELTWLQALLYELGIRLSSTPILWCDYLGATCLSANPIFHARIKHVEIDFVQEKVAQGDVRVQHISTYDQIADIFTKPLPTPRLLFLRSKL